MDQLEINKIIMEVNDKLVILDEYSNELKKYNNLSKLYYLFNNPDTDWRVFYYLSNSSVLREWLSILSDFYYLNAYENESKVIARFKEMEEVSVNLLYLLEQTLTDKTYTNEDDRYSSLLQNYLKQYKNFHFLTSKVSEFEKTLIELEKNFKKISDKKINVDLEEEKIIQVAEFSKGIIEELKEKKEFLNKITDDKTNSEIKGLYKEIYDREILIANKYRNWTLIIFILIAFLLVWKFFNINFSFDNWGIKFAIPSKEFVWESVLNTLILLGLSTPAWYLAKESSKHRKVAYKAQMLGTELASFPLYAREFKDEDRLELRKHLADRFFGQELYSDSKTTNSNDNSLEQMKLMTETNKVLAEALKAKRS